MRLGDNLSQKFLCLRTSALGVVLIEQKTAIYFLAIMLHAGNNRSKGEWTSMINVHKEIGPVFFVLPKKVRIKELKIRHWK